jgi:hypothetical protein
MSRSVAWCVVPSSAGSGSFRLPSLLVDTALTSKKTSVFRQVVETYDDNDYLIWKDVKGLWPNLR